MANKKISELPYIDGSKISGNTLVPLVTYFSAATGDTVHTFVDDLQTYLISGLTGQTDVFVTGGTYSAGTITFSNNTGGTFNVTGLTTGSTSTISGDYLPLSGGTVTGDTIFTQGLSATTISATTYLNLPINTDVFVTGGTYSNGDATFTNNTGGTFNVSGFYTGETSYVNSLNTGVGLSADTTTGNITILNTDPDQIVTISGGTGITTGGTYPNFTITNSLPDQTVTLVEGSNISVTGSYPNFILNVTGLTDNDIYVTGFTYDNNNTFTISKNSGSSLNATINTVSGLTVNGNLSATTISATTYLNLPLGIYGTGLTFNTGNYDLTIDGGNGILDTVSLSILASDLTITGGTYDPNTGTATFTNNTGGTFNVTGFLTGMTDTFVTGGTYSAGTITFTNTSGGTFEVSGLTTGDTTTITGATSVGTGLTIFDSVVNRNVQINSITGDSFNKITTTLSSNTIEVGVNEQNLTLWDLVVQGNRLLNGYVSYVSGLTFSVSPLEYLINGTIYDISSATTVTLNSGDTLYDRIDVIYADISGNTGVLEGTPSENPEKPLVDGDTQVEVTFVLVPANSTTPDVNSFIIYNENSGPPSEWTFGSGGSQPTRISGNSTDDTYSGITSIKVSGVTGSYTTFFTLTGDTVLDTNQYATLQFAMKNLSANTTTSRIRFRFLSTGGTQNGNAVFMNSAGSAGYVQYSSTNTTSWQLISIPLWRFYLTNTNVQALEVAFYPIGTGAQARYYFDLFEFVEGTSSSPPSNSWTTIKGDGTTTITAPNPNATLTISGGTNIGSFISGTSTVVLNLDNNINLNGISATTISATTYQNLPTDVRVTGGTYSAGTITFSNNTGGTFNVTGLTTGSTSTVSGEYLPLSGGTVTGNTIFSQGLTATTISATTYQNLPTDVRVTGTTYSNNTFTFTNNTGGTFNVLFNTVTGLTVNGNLTVTGSSSLQTLTASTTTINGNLTVTGNTNVKAFTGTTGYISGSGQNILTVIGSGNSTTSPLFSVQGSSGELFSVTDSLVGSLFSVNDISGLPIMEVFSDNTTLWGSYQAPSLNTTVKTSAGTGSTTVYTIPQSAYTGAFFEYTVSSTLGARAGNIMSIFSGSTAQYTETTTNDIGTTTGLTFSVSANSTNAVLLASGATAGWTIKTIVRSI